MAMTRTANVGRFAALRLYFRDKDASFFGKAFVLFAVAYVATPIDLIPEAFVPVLGWLDDLGVCLLYTSPSPRDRTRSRMPSSA